LKDADPISTYKIVDGCVLHLVRSRKPAAAVAPTPTPVAATQHPSAAGLPGMPQAGGGMPGMPAGMDLASMAQNPGFQAAMSQMMQNPAMMEQVINSNPQLAAGMTPQMRQLMSNPGFMQMIMNPNVLLFLIDGQ
jgi:ubiquilin